MKHLVANLDYTKDTYQADLATVLNWLGDLLDPNQLKEEFVKYCATFNRDDEAKLVPANKLISVGKLAYCCNMGAKLEQRSVDKIISTLDFAATSSDKTISLEDIEETARSKAAISYVNCYSLIDNALTTCLKNKQDLKILTDEVRSVIRKYSNNKKPILTQLAEHYRELYNDVKNDVLVKEWTQALSAICDTIDLMLSTTKTNRRTKKKNGLSVDRKAEKAASNLTYKIEDRDLGIKSLQPHAVIGAKAVVLYNTRNKHCEVYMAGPDQTLSLKGSYLLNFDIAKSCSKTIRKPQENLIHWTSAGNLRRLEVLLDNTPGKSKPVKGKFNQNIVIIKAIH